MAIVINEYNLINKIFTEPCMNCYKHIQYCKAEAFDSKEVTGGKAIICPNCGNEMLVRFCNIHLC